MRIYLIGASKSAIGILKEFLNSSQFYFENINLISASFHWKNQLIEFKSEENYFSDFLFT